MKPTNLPPDKLCQVLNRIPARFKQALRLVEYLAGHPRTVTVEANRACAIGNISDVAHKVNPYLWPFGYMIGCERPPAPMPNRFGEPSNMFLWSVFEVERHPLSHNENGEVMQA